MTRGNQEWNKRSELLKIIGAIFNATLGFFVTLSMMFTSLVGQLQDSSNTYAAACSLSNTISSTVEITPNSSDNVIDCSGEDITITSTGKLILKSYKSSDTSNDNDGGVILVVDNLTIENGGSISSDGQGYIPGDTDGGSATESTGVAAGSGGGNGGAGGAGNTVGGEENQVGETGTTIGKRYFPITLGGAGGNAGGGGVGGKGGGAIKLEVDGEIQIDGVISANGLSGEKSADNQTAGGGGAGGSIWIEASSIDGTGTVSAVGGGTDQTVSYFGGGGGGGRVVMIASDSSSFSEDNVHIEQGEGSQDGGRGTLVGPGVRPSAPTVLKFYETNSVFGRVDRELNVGDLTRKTKITFASDLEEDGQKLEIELRETSQGFIGNPTLGQTQLSEAKDCTDIPGESAVEIGDYCGFAETTPLIVSTEYKWQARIINEQDIYSTWVQYGGNAVTETDFTVVGEPTGLEIVQGNNQTIIAGKLAPVTPTVKVVDSAGYGVPFYSEFGWSVLSGGGSIENGDVAADSFGLMNVDWTVGTSVGIDNNSIKVRRIEAPNIEAVFLASVVPDAVDHYIVDTYALTISVVDTDFNYSIQAKDQYNNNVSINTSLDVTPVSAYDDVSPGLGTLTPDTTNIVDGAGDVVGARYTYTETIKVKVVDANGKFGLSKSILFVSELGACPAVVIDQSQTWNAEDVPGGVFDCRGLGLFHVTDESILALNSYENGDTDYTNDYGVTILMDALQVDSGSSIEGDDLGYPWGEGPADAMYGGYAPPPTTGNPYGSLFEPISLGSGGSEALFSTPGSGGGAVKIVVTEDSEINGIISSNGRDYEGHWAYKGDGGAGGSVWLDTVGLSGTGMIQTNGGLGDERDGRGSSGSGGRIAVYYESNSGFLLDGGHLQSYGNTAGYSTSGAGTVYVEHKGADSPQHGTLIIDNNGNDSIYTAAVPHGEYEFVKIDLKRHGNVEILTNGGMDANPAVHSKLTLSNVASLVGDETTPLIKVSGVFNYTDTARLTLDGVDLGINGKESGIEDITVGGGNVAGLTLYAKTWYHNNSVGHTFGDLTVKNGSTVALVSNPNEENDEDDYGVNISLTSLDIETGGLMHSNALGYPTRTGPSHGMHGGFKPNPTAGRPYGDVYEPITLGSAGWDDYYGTNGAGGGAIKLTVSNATVINGILSSNGQNADGIRGEGGAGGSIWLDTSSISGDGTITTNGGTGKNRSGHGSGGSGGRMSIYYNNNIDFDLTSVTLQSYGNNSSGIAYAGAGTVYLEHKGVDANHGGTLLVDNNGHQSSYTAGVPHGDYAFAEIKTTRYGNVEFMDDGEGEDEADHSKLTVSSGDGLTGDDTKPLIKVSGTLNYTGEGLLTLDGVDLGINGKESGIEDITVGGGNVAGLTLYAKTWYHNNSVGHTFGNVLIKSGSIVKMLPYQNGDTNWTNDYGVKLHSNNLEIESGALMEANYTGYAASKGPGFSINTRGANYGGYGAGEGGEVYGDLYKPISFGSGSSNSGGGVIRLFVNNTFTHNGVIETKGANSLSVGMHRMGGGGSGGSIFVDTLKMDGNGEFNADGGDGGNGIFGSSGGGGGGRIAIYYENGSFPLENENNVHAFGGSIFDDGGPGTIYVEQKNVHKPNSGNLLISNRGLIGQTGDFEPIDYTFHNVTIGENVTVPVKSDLEKVTEGYIRPAAHAALPTDDTFSLWHFNDAIPITYVNEFDTNKNAVVTAMSESVDGKFEKGQKTKDGYGIAFPEIALPVNYSIEAWVKFPLPTTSDGWRTLTWSSDSHHILVNSDGQLGLWNGSWIDSGYNVNSLTGWNYITLTASNGVTTYYINGESVGSVDTILTAPIRVIGNKDINGHQQIGEIDEVRISDIAFSAPEVSQLYASEDAPDVLSSTIALWHFDEDVNKIRADNNTTSYAFVSADTGIYDGALSFNGSDQYVNLPGTPSDFSNGMTVEFWAKPTSNGSWARFFDFGNGASNNNIYLSRNDTSDSLKLGVLNAGSYIIDLDAPDGIINDEWHHYAVSIDENDAIIYRDGIEIAKGAGALPNNISRINNYIGRSNWSGNAYYQGYLDDFHIYSRTLSHSEINAHAKGYTLAEAQGVLEQTVGRGATLYLSGNFSLAAGAKIDGTGKGFATGDGMGHGGDGEGYTGGGGGANGGEGGNGQGQEGEHPGVGGEKYGNQLVPLTIGSGGGKGSTGARGGYGGGSIAIIAKGQYNEEEHHYDNGNLQILGDIIMNGSIGLTGSPGGGGGAGGSILLHGNTCQIDGNLSAIGGEGGNSDVDGGSGGGGRISVLYNVGPCNVNGTVDISEGTPSDAANYSGQVGQEGTYPPEPNSVPWPSQYKDQFELRTPEANNSRWKEPVFAQVEDEESISGVLGASEAVIPIGGIINGTTVTLKADAYDAGARALIPKHLKIQVELKEVTHEFDGESNIYESEIITFSGGDPVVLDVTIEDLIMGTSYKWQVRTVNVDNNLYSEWQEFGDNGETPDFTITTVNEINLVVSPSTINMADTTSMTVTARNTEGLVDTSYRGTVRFTSNSSTADLPTEYTFTTADAGEHTFHNSIKFYESGTFSIIAEDIINPMLVDTEQVTVVATNVPFLFLGASDNTILVGDSVTLTWNSHLISNVQIDHEIGSVNTAGSTVVSPPLGTITYTARGDLENGEQLTATVTIIVSNQIIPTLTPTPSVSGTDIPHPTITVTPILKQLSKCPIIVNFDIDQSIIKQGDVINVSWHVNNADFVSIDAFGSNLPAIGSSSIMVEKSAEITLFASKWTCKRKDTISIDVVNAYPWEEAGGMLIGLLALETIALQIGAVNGNIWLALLGLIDRNKKRKPWGVVYDSVTKEPVVRAVVRLWESKHGTLVDTVVTDINGIFKLTPKKGAYVLKIAMPGYSFPSKLVSKDTDSGYTNIYSGEVINIEEDADQIMVSIPIDPEVKSQKRNSIYKLMESLKAFLLLINPIILIAGFIYSAVVTVMYPNTFNYIVLGFYFITFSFKLWAYTSKQKTYGIVTDIEGKVVSGLEIGLFDKEFNTLIARTFSNRNGAYNFVVKNTDYYLQVLDSTYKLLDKRATKDGVLVDKNYKRSNVRLITENILVYPVKKVSRRKQ